MLAPQFTFGYGLFIISMAKDYITCVEFIIDDSGLSEGFSSLIDENFRDWQGYDLVVCANPDQDNVTGYFMENDVCDIY